MTDTPSFDERWKATTSSLEDNPPAYPQPAQPATPVDPGLRPRPARPVTLPTAPPVATPDGDTDRAPRLGQIVLYRSRTGTYTMPAMISAIGASLYRPNVDAGHVPDLTSPHHVHLAVFTCGLPGHLSATTAERLPELADPDRPNRPAGGTYAEWDIPFWDPTFDGGDRLDAWLDGDLTAQPAGTWTWTP